LAEWEKLDVELFKLFLGDVPNRELGVQPCSDAVVCGWG
jgi:hypothetical protein